MPRQTPGGRAGFGGAAMKKLSPAAVRAVFWRLLFLGAIFGFIGAFTEARIWMIVGVCVMTASAVFYVIFYRCPHCGSYLDRNTGEFCPNCGKEIRQIITYQSGLRAHFHTPFDMSCGVELCTAPAQEKTPSL